MTMNDTRARLNQCFAAVFPDLSREQFETATVQRVKNWDSIAMVTLVGLVEEEFACSITLEDIPNLDSFEKLYRHLEARRET
jgi:acyl carrier protein